MANNLFLITPYQDKFYDIVISNLQHAFAKQDYKNVEIQFKYALINYFHQNFNENDFREIPTTYRYQVESLFRKRADEFLDSLKILSKQSVILLNPLGKEIYSLVSGFNEYQNKKFYHIREFFTKLCIYTESTNYKRYEPKKQLCSMYQHLASFNFNHTFQMIDQNEIRIDLYIKEKTSSQLQGRHSYTQSQGWKKTIKEPLCKQSDYAFAEQFFRMAINKEIQTNLSNKDMQPLAKICKSITKPFDIRLKRQMRVCKGNIFQFTFSQVFNINDLKICADLGDLMSETKEVFNDYLRKLFINFYSASLKDQKKTGFEMELQFTKQTNKRLKRFLSEKRYEQVRNEIKMAVEELLVIYYAEYTTKVRETAWMNRIIPNKVAQGRLQNEFGNHMRQRIYRLMDASIDPNVRHKPNSSQKLPKK